MRESSKAHLLAHVPPSYAVDRMAAKEGHTVVPYHCFVNPIRTALGVAKRRSQKETRTDTQQVGRHGCVPALVWEDPRYRERFVQVHQPCRKKNGARLLEMDGVTENEVPPLLVPVDDSFDEDSDGTGYATTDEIG